MAKVAVLGSGVVGQTLAKGFAKHGHEVKIASREGNKLGAFSQETGIPESTFAESAGWAEIVVLAVQGGVAEALVQGGAGSLEGKVVIDTNNPIAGAPVNGFLPYFTTNGVSLMEILQKAAPGGRFVKAFNSVGNAFMVNPSFPGGRPTMFICGDDAGAKGEVASILDAFGWDAEDVGGAQMAGPLEALCQIWCAPGFLRGDWAHAFKVVKP